MVHTILVAQVPITAATRRKDKALTLHDESTTRMERAFYGIPYPHYLGYNWQVCELGCQEEMVQSGKRNPIPYVDSVGYCSTKVEW